ncbi:MAG: hypothetical protein OEU92_07080 [Alphaproteobacteria bacterium]|nr:hypothetical protein [Alphaproteobacteria bacterium]
MKHLVLPVNHLQPPEKLLTLQLVVGSTGRVAFEAEGGEAPFAVMIGDLADRLAALALPDIRDRWLPSEANTWSRVTKAHMLDLLGQLGMGDAARQMKTAKKTTLAGYMMRLFAAPPSRLTPEQLAAVRAWAPDGMKTVAPDEAADEEALAA